MLFQFFNFFIDGFFSVFHFHTFYQLALQWPAGLCQPYRNDNIFYLAEQLLSFTSFWYRRDEPPPPSTSVIRSAT